MLILLQLDCTLFQNLLTLAKWNSMYISYKAYIIYGMTDTVQQL